MKYSGAEKMSTVSPETSLRGGTLQLVSSTMGLSVSMKELSEKLSTTLTCPRVGPGCTILFWWGTVAPTFSLSEKTLGTLTLLEDFLGCPAFSSQKMVKSVFKD